jgi:transcriptional regulator with XRE-family HTH domain
VANEHRNQSDVYDVGGRIREFRRAQKLTQEALAAEMESSTKTVSRVEIGDTALTIGGFFKACDVLGVSPNDLSPERFRQTERCNDASAQEFLTIYMGLNVENRRMLHKLAKALTAQEAMASS